MPSTCPSVCPLTNNQSTNRFLLSNPPINIIYSFIHHTSRIHFIFYPSNQHIHPLIQSIHTPIIHPPIVVCSPNGGGKGHEVHGLVRIMVFGPVSFILSTLQNNTSAVDYPSFISFSSIPTTYS